MQRRYLALVILATSGMIGCVTKPPTTDTTAQMLDAKLAASAQRIEQLLIDIAAASGLPTTVSVQKPDQVMKQAGLMTVRWQGDAPKVLREIAKVKGLKFTVIGRPVPIPVSLQLVNVSLVHVLESIGMQLGGRADVVLKLDAVELRYHAI